MRKQRHGTHSNILGKCFVRQCAFSASHVSARTIDTSSLLFSRLQLQFVFAPPSTIFSWVGLLSIYDIVVMHLPAHNNLLRVVSHQFGTIVQ